MRAVSEGKLPATSSSFQLHIDRCLGCRACEPVCPAGVEYGQLLEASRAELFVQQSGHGLSYRLLQLALRHVWLHPGRLRFAFSAARVLRDTGLPALLAKSGFLRIVLGRIQFALGLLASSAPQIDRGNHERLEVTEQSREAVETVSLFSGCVTAGLFERVNEATKRVLQVNGFSAQVPSSQVCCGALHAHAGDLEGARVLARQNIAAFGSDSSAVVTNAGGCGAMLASYHHLLEHDEQFAQSARSFVARVRDVSQQLESGVIKEGAALEESVTYDASCHLLNGQHATEAPLKLLRGIPNLKFVSLEGSERCCGGAGVYNLLEPQMSGGVLAEKLGHIRETGACVLATGNPGCQMQIGAGARLANMDLRLCHPIELLDESYRRAGLYD
jgi:glycolate oxidase iron-sulfur subunit